MRSLAIRVGQAAGAGLMLVLLGTAGAQTSGTGGGSGSGNGNGASRAQPNLPPSQQMPGSTIPSIGAPEVTDDRMMRMEQEQAKMRNVDRQKKLVEDTEKLLSLANQLKEEVGKSNKDTLSLDVVKKAEEIEKLAHSVKEKMKGT